MSTILFSSPIFGPVKSRRLGLSLGINLLPADGKVCSFDCIYCECGLNAERRPTLRMPTRALVRETLEEKLQTMSQEGALPDTLTFAGNGEPTGHPEFEAIIEDTCQLRDRYCPQAKISVLSNALHILKEDVFRALLRVDNALLKLDTVDKEYIRLVNRPTNGYPLDKLIERMKAFNGKCLIQTMFMKGTWLNQNVDNTTEQYVLPWLETIKAIRPSCVTIYTIDRETPDKALQKASHAELDAIANLVRQNGISCTVSY